MKKPKLPSDTDIANWMVPLIKTIDETQQFRRAKWKNNATTSVHQRFSISMFQSDQEDIEITDRQNEVERYAFAAGRSLATEIGSQLGDCWIGITPKQMLQRPAWVHTRHIVSYMVDMMDKIQGMERVVPLVCDVMFLYGKRKRKSGTYLTYGHSHVMYSEQLIVGFGRFSDPAFKTAYLITR